MLKCYQKLVTDKSYAVGWAVLSFFIIAIASVVVAIFFIITASLSADRSNGGYENTITVEGYGEVDSTPDVATLSFSIEEEATTVEVAQEEAVTKMNATLAYLRDQNVEEKDIKVTGYNVYPKYEWAQEVCRAGTICPPGRNEQVGFVFNQSVSVKIRDLDNAGNILANIGTTGVTNISGLQFLIDDDTKLKEEAQRLAIVDAKERAKRLTEELGVKLDDLISFYESGDRYPQPYYGGAMMESAVGMGSSADRAMAVPDLPTGETTISSQVSVTYKIK